jgi:hypothetical protein
MTHAEKIKRLEALMTEPLVCEFHELAAKIDAWERLRFPIALPSIGSAMNFRRNQMGENQKQISVRAGMSLNRWKILESGKVEPSIADARKLHKIGIPASVILQENAKIVHPATENHQPTTTQEND